jgi:hypothetical protein
MPHNQVIAYNGIYEPPGDIEGYTDWTMYRRSMLGKSVVFFSVFATEAITVLMEEPAAWVVDFRTGIFAMLVVDYMLCAWAKGFFMVVSGRTPQRSFADFVPHHSYNIKFQNMFFGVMVFFGGVVMARIPWPEESLRTAFVMAVDLFMMFHHCFMVAVGGT